MDGFSWTLLISGCLLALHTTAIFFVLRAVRFARTPQGAVGWAIFLMVMPYFGVPAYLMFGDFRYPSTVRDRRLSEAAARMQEDSEAFSDALPTLSVKDQATMRAFEGLSDHTLLPGNALKLMAESKLVFDTLFDAIRGAQKYVLIETYILRDDGLGRELQDLLLQKSAEGVRVCVLYDPFGSYGLHGDYLARMREGGIEVVNFHARHPERRLALTRVNFRNHRKIAIVDGVVAFTGGYNIGDEYIGRNPHLGTWRDTMIRIQGPLVVQLQMHFAEDWHWATGEVVSVDWRSAKSAGTVPAMVLASGPSDEVETGSLFFMNAITAAHNRIWIASPYFTPDTALMQSLRLAARRGVDVRVIMAGKRDHWLVWLAAFAFMEAMRGSGVKMYRYADGFMHQKVVLIDDTIASVGSHNLDSRSCRLNFELSAIMVDAGFAGEVEQMLLRDFEKAERYTRPLSQAPLGIRVAAPIARLFAPLL